MTARARRLAIGIVAFDGVTALDLVGPLEVFAVANEVAARQGVPARYDVRILGVGDRDRFVAESGLVFLAHEVLRRAPALDTLIVPGGAGLREPKVNAELVAVLRRRAPRTRRIASVCTGIYALAATGLLDGRRATTHWRFARDAATRFPRVAIDAESIYVRDGNFYTSAGVTAGIDLALAFVEADLGPSVALAVARDLVVFLKRQGGQSQYSAPLRFQSSTTDPIHETGAWILDHLDEALSIERLSARAHLSPRQFNRRFADAHDMTPAAFVREARLDAAHHMLLERHASVSRIADATGFRSADAFSRAFERRFGVRPSDFRARFARSSAPKGRGRI